MERNEQVRREGGYVRLLLDSAASLSFGRKAKRSTALVGFVELARLDKGDSFVMRYELIFRLLAATFSRSLISTPVSQI